MIEESLIHVFKSDVFNGYSILVNSNGYYPVQISNIQFYPGIISRFYINMIPDQNKEVLQSVSEIKIVHAAEDAQQDSIREITLTLGIDGPRESLTYFYAEKFAEEVNALSDGKMKIDVYTDAALGNDRQMFNSIIQDRSPEFIIQTTAPQVTFIPKLSVFDIPMVFNDADKLRDTIDNESFYNKIENVYSEGGYKLLGMADEQFRQMTSNLEIRDIEQFGGIKIRTIQNPNHIRFWQLLGSIVIPLPVGEIYSSLVHGFIDAQENPYGNIAAFEFYEVQDYVIDTCHLPHFMPLITSNEIFNSLTEREQEIITEAARRATLYTREEADRRLEQVKAMLVENGMTIVELPENTRQEIIRIAAKPVYESIKTLVNDDELLNEYLKLSSSAQLFGNQQG
ncbi:MAG: TRAP transporter substrate-binding protein [Sedimentibacter sp.]|uniref:TRAP transporter substrate-binding protein n=1 Tax=Sedimentibacter sp. TaxID=1960295 RepID=UPI00315846B6